APSGGFLPGCRGHSPDEVSDPKTQRQKLLSGSPGKLPHLKRHRQLHAPSTRGPSPSRAGCFFLHQLPVSARPATRQYDSTRNKPQRRCKLLCLSTQQAKEFTVCNTKSLDKWLLVVLTCQSKLCYLSSVHPLRERFSR